MTGYGHRPLATDQRAARHRNLHGDDYRVHIATSLKRGGHGTRGQHPEAGVHKQVSPRLAA